MAKRKPPTRSRRFHDLKVVVEKHSDGCIAYPLGLAGVVVGQGDTYEEALADVKSAVAFHVETFRDTGCHCLSRF